MTEEPVVRLPAKDAIAVLRLLEGFQSVLREGGLGEECRRLAAAGSDLRAAQGPWQEQLAARVAAACGLLRQSLEGFDASSVIARSGASTGAAAADR